MATFSKKVKKRVKKGPFLATFWDPQKSNVKRWKNFCYRHYKKVQKRRKIALFCHFLHFFSLFWRGRKKRSFLRF